MRPLNPVDGVRGALFRTLPGRAIVVGVTIKIVVALLNAAMGGVPAFLGVIETVASVAAVAGLVYFGFQLAVLAKRRLLWRVRRKLLVSYLFVGVLPAILLAAFALLCGFLLFYNLSSYLVQSRLRALSDNARFVAQTTALEIQRGGGQDVAAILARRQSSIEADYPGASMAVIAVGPDCHADHAPIIAAAGRWAHTSPPQSIPSWIPCSGFAGVLAYDNVRDPASNRDTHLLVRAVVFPDTP